MGEIRREQTRRGVYGFLLNEGSNTLHVRQDFLQFDTLYSHHLYRTFCLSADSTPKSLLFCFVRDRTHHPCCYSRGKRHPPFTLIWRQTEARESALILFHHECKFTRQGVKVAVNVVELPWLRLCQSIIVQCILYAPPRPINALKYLCEDLYHANS
jgi:hypothetical protein